MKIAILTTDNREHFRTYDNPVPFFGTAPEALLQGLAGIPEIEVHVVSCARQVMRSPEKLADNIWFHSLLAPKIGWMTTAYQGCIRVVRKKLAAIRPVIVHGQGTERECAISSVFSGFPSVLTIHGNMRLIAQVTRARAFSYPWLAAQLEKVIIPRTRGVVCITRYTRDAVTDLNRKTWVVPNAVDAAFFKVPPEPENPRIILCVGHVCVRKNQNAFIRSLDALAAGGPVKLVFLGGTPKNDPYVAEFLDLVSKRPWCESGFANRETLKDWLKRATLLALPSLEDNCPMVVLEAMAAGVPVLAANVGGLPDLVEDGVTGLFCDPLDPASMAAGVKKLLSSPDLARQLATTAKQRALDRYHPLVIARRHVEIYREVLSIPS